MKVKELIAALQKQDPNDEVIVHLGDVDKTESNFFTPVGVEAGAGIFDDASRGFRFVGRHEPTAVMLSVFELDTL